MAVKMHVAATQGSAFLGCSGVRQCELRRLAPERPARHVE